MRGSSVALTLRFVEKHSILIVDDEADMRMVLSRALTAAGYEVVTVGDGRQAFEVMAQRSFDLILTDILMPEKDGVQVLTEAHRKYPKAKTIAMTGGGHIPPDAYLQIAGGLGANALLKKPFDPAQLVTTVNAVLAKK